MIAETIIDYHELSWPFERALRIWKQMHVRCVLCARASPRPRFPLSWKRTNSTSKVQLLGQQLPANVCWLQVLYCKRRSAKIYALKRIVNLFCLLATAATDQVAFHYWEYAIYGFTPNMPLSLASVRRHLTDRTPARRKILKPTPKIFGVT